MTKNLTPARAKSKDGQPTSICNRYLPLLGFEDKSCLKDDLFVVPNREAFHQVCITFSTILYKNPQNITNFYGYSLKIYDTFFR